jgi:hypothetical protein
MGAMATLTPAPRLRGREQELQALGDAFDQVASGHPAVVIVEGRQASARPGCLPRPSILARTPRSARWWPFVGSTALAVSMTGPSYLSDGADAVALMTMHLLVGATLIYGFATSQPSWCRASGKCQ